MIRSDGERDVKDGGDMTPERWQRVKNIFEGAIAENAANRSAYLEQQCAADTALRSEVETLLASDAKSMTVLGEGAASALGALMAQEGQQESRGLVGRRLGHYRILEEIGRGGMAMVYAAVRDDHEYQQRVAIKLIRRGMDTEPLIARFRQERQILANLDHPNIARLIDGGVTEDGLPYLVMEAIEGEPIDVYADRHVLTTTQRLELFRTVCGAVHYAHQNLVVHRDLKPSNILVTGEGVPKLLDFGIAKLLEPSDDDQSPDPTIGGPRPMTPTYASPEQLRGEAITTASDVYVLGVLLYGLITGHRPFRFETTTHAEVARVVCGQDPERPSTVIEREIPSSSEGSAPDVVRSETLGQLRSRLRGDLDNIVLMALEKQPQQRYASAAAFADDVRRHLAGEPVTARKDTAWYRTSRFVRRHRLGVAAAATVVLSLLGGIAATTWQAREARVERIEAELQRSNAEVVSAFMVGLFELWHDAPDLGNSMTARQLLDRGAAQLEHDTEMKSLKRATLLDHIGIAYFKLGLYEQAEPLVAEGLSLRENLLPDDDPALATSLHSVGELRLQQGHLDVAETLLRRALSIRRARLDRRHELVAETENKLGLVLRRQGRLNEAEALLREAVTWQREALGSDHKEFAQSLTMLGLVHKDRGDRKEAEKLFREALEVTKARFGEDHSLVAAPLNNLAGVLRDQSNCEEGQILYERALAIEQANLPAGHSEIATSFHNLAGCHKDLGEYDEAERLYYKALDIRIAAFGPDHFEVAGTLNNLGELATQRRRWATAESYLRRALVICNGQGNSCALILPGVCFNLAHAMRVQGGDLEEAEMLATRALEGDREVLGAGHESLEKRLFLVAQIQMDRGRFATAETQLWVHLESLRRRLGDQNKPVAVARIELARSLAGQGDAASAELQLRLALSTLADLEGDESRAVAVAESALASALVDLGELAEAEELLLRSHPVLYARYGADHSRTKMSIERLISLYQALGLPDAEARHRTDRVARTRASELLTRIMNHPG